MTTEADGDTAKFLSGSGQMSELLMLPLQLLRRAITYLWQVPPSLPQPVRLEWRFVAIRWLGILFVAPGLPLANLPTRQLLGAYAVLIVAAGYNLALQRLLPRYPARFASGYVTTVCDSLLNIGLMFTVGGFDSPFYYILYTVTISAAMRYGYGPAVAMGLIFISFDGVENLAILYSLDAPFVFRSGFLLITAILAGYLREQARRAEAELEARLHQANALNKELEAFAYSVSHDLRAPLRGIDGFSQALLEDYADKLDAEGKDYLQRVRAASQRMSQLIDDLLKLSRVTRGEIHRERVNLSALARTVAAGLQQTQLERQVDFIIAEELFASGDEQLLRVVLENLLGNAWKFTERHLRATIEFGATRQDDEVAYFVRDNGVGFDMTYSDKLFRPFQRLHAVDEFPGTGIGLATVQRIIHRHGGRVWAEGVVDQGAAFYFTL